MILIMLRYFAFCKILSFINPDNLFQIINNSAFYILENLSI